MKEFRHVFGDRVKVETRADGKKTIVGYGAVFHRAGDPGTEYELWPGLVERVDRHAFDRAIVDDDVRSAFNHDVSLILGRKAAGTLRLTVDEIGLRYEVDPPAARADVLESIERGDVTGSSFAFEPLVQEWRDDGDRELRILKDVRLHETGPVTFPAYTSATAGVRAASMTDVRQQYEAWKSTKTTQADSRKIAIRARLVELDLTSGRP